MQTLTRMDNVVIEDYFHMTTMNEYLDETNAFIVNCFSKPKHPFCTLIAFIVVHIKGK
jgi:hypothetical protein